jgi:hypothetical protein
MSFTVQANWKRRAEIIDYCVKVVDEAQVGQSDHRAGTDVGTRPSSSSLSLGGTDEAKVKQLIVLIATVRPPLNYKICPRSTGKCITSLRSKRLFDGVPLMVSQRSRHLGEVSYVFHASVCFSMPVLRATAIGRGWPKMVEGGT